MAGLMKHSASNADIKTEDHRNGRDGVDSIVYDLSKSCLYMALYGLAPHTARNSPSTLGSPLLTIATQAYRPQVDAESSAVANT